MKIFDNILQYFDLKNNKIKRYFELEQSIINKKQEANELAKSYCDYKKECEELIKGATLNKKEIQGVSSHVEERFNKYFMNYVNKLGEIKKSTEDLIGEKNKILNKYPELFQEIEKAEKESFNKKEKVKKVMDEFKNGELKSSSGEKVTDRKQAVAIALNEVGLSKAQLDEAIVTIVKGYENGFISPDKFKELKKELQFYVELEKAEKLEGGLADNKTLDDIAKKHKVDLKYIEEQFKLGVKIEKEHTKDGEKAGEIVRDHLMEDPDYYTKLEEMEKKKSEEPVIEKAIKEEPKETKAFADAIIRNKEGKILFLHRSKDVDFQPDTMSLPGGHINENETDEDAVKRELLEETQLVAKSVFKVAQASNPLISYFEVEVEDTDDIVLVFEEHQNYQWIAMNSEEWKNANMIMNLKENLEKIFDVNYKIKQL